ncbi:MAG: rRNA (cytidine-2'-O-)-methyltransferase, partial [Sphaerochaetaceae bacterium]
PFRVVKLLGELAQLAPTRALLVGREMTKIYEEFVEGSALEVEREFAARPSIKGEFALCIYPERGE